MKEKQTLNHLARVFHGSFWLTVGCYISVIMFSSDGNDGALLAALFLVSISGLAYYVSLGMIAHNVGRSWIKWCGLSFILPFAGIIGYIWMGHIIAIEKLKTEE